MNYHALWLLSLLLTVLPPPAGAGTRILLIARDNKDNPLPGVRFAYQGVESSATNQAGATELDLPSNRTPGMQIKIQLVPSSKRTEEWFLVNPQVNIPDVSFSAELVLMRRSEFREVAVDVLDRWRRAATNPYKPTEKDRKRTLVEAAASRGLTPGQLEEAIRSFGETQDPRDKGIASYLEGDYAQAEGLLVQAAEKEKAKLLETLRYLRDAQEQRGQHDAAARASLEALALIASKSFLDALEPNSDIYAIRERMDRDIAMLAPWEDVELCLREELAATEKSYGPNDSAVARDLIELGAVLGIQRRFAEAESLYRRALLIDEQKNSDQAVVARDLNDLAGLLRAANRPNEAIPLFRRKLAVDQKRYPPDHPEIARDLSKLADVLQESGKLTEAEPLMRLSFFIICKFEYRNWLGEAIKNKGLRRTLRGDLF